MAASVSPAASRFVAAANSATATTPSSVPKTSADRGATVCRTSGLPLVRRITSSMSLSM